MGQVMNFLSTPLTTDDLSAAIREGGDPWCPDSDRVGVLVTVYLIRCLGDCLSDSVPR